MAIQMNVAEAKVKLSELLDAAAEGRDVVIARSGTPIARLVAVAAPTERTLGFLSLDVDDAFFDPLIGDTVDAWE